MNSSGSFRPVSTWTTAGSSGICSPEYLVEQVLALMQQLGQGRSDGLQPVMTKAAFLLLAKAFLDCQTKFGLQHKSTRAQVAFHYTHSSAVPFIAQQGLLPPNNDHASSPVARHGGNYGSGVYVGNNPHAFSYYGDTGIVVLILQGEILHKHGKSDVSNGASHNDSFVGNKLMRDRNGGFEWPKSPYFDEIVLRQGCQVLPLAFYPRQAINNREFFWDVKCRVQALTDRILNHNVSMPMSRILPSWEDFQFECSVLKPLRKKHRKQQQQKRLHIQHVLQMTRRLLLQQQQHQQQQQLQQRQQLQLQLQLQLQQQQQYDQQDSRSVAYAMMERQEMKDGKLVRVLYAVPYRSGPP